MSSDEFRIRINEVLAKYGVKIAPAPADALAMAIDRMIANRLPSVDPLRLKERIDIRLNNRLCEMKPNEDDSIVGFNEAWDIVRQVFASASLTSTQSDR
jgi:hypothetical protein